MQVHEYWLCLPASHVRPFVRTVRVRPSGPHCCWFPRVLPSVPKPPCVPATLPRVSHSAVLPPSPSSTAPPSTSQASSSPDPKLCLSPPTADGRQEKNVQSGLVSWGLFWLLRLKFDFCKNFLVPVKCFQPLSHISTDFCFNKRLY